jgi:flagellar assembly protein FliH
MARNVLSGDEVKQLSDGFPVENASWKNTILIRAREETERRRRQNVTRPAVEGDEVVPAAVFAELGAPSPAQPLEPVDPRQAALDEAEAILQSTREEAEAIASNIKEDAKARASLMVEKAQSEVKELLDKARINAEAEADRVKRNAAEEGRQQGFEQGVAEGSDKGRADVKAEFAGSLKQWNEVLLQTVEERKRTLTEARSLIVELVGESLYRCLKDEGLRRSDMAVKFVEEALKKAHDRVHLKVHLNPGDLATVEARKKELQVSVGSSQIELVSDGRIEKGGCLLETEAGSIDARLSTVVTQVMDALSPGV